MWRRQQFVESIPVELPILDSLYDAILADSDTGAFASMRAFEKLQSIEKHAINSLVRNGERVLVNVTDYDKYILHQAAINFKNGATMRSDEHLYYDEAC